MEGVDGRRPRRATRAGWAGGRQSRRASSEAAGVRSRRAGGVLGCFREQGRADRKRRKRGGPGSHGGAAQASVGVCCRAGADRKPGNSANGGGITECGRQGKGDRGGEWLAVRRKGSDRIGRSESCSERRPPDGNATPSGLLPPLPKREAVRSVMFGRDGGSTLGSNLSGFGQ
jgi:hypothetical protein